MLEANQRLEKDVEQLKLALQSAEDRASFSLETEKKEKQRLMEEMERLRRGLQSSEATGEREKRKLEEEVERLKLALQSAEESASSREVQDGAKSKDAELEQLREKL